MDMFCFISGIMSKPYIPEITACICVTLLFCCLCWYCLNRAIVTYPRVLFSWLTVVCAVIAIASFCLAFFYSGRAYTSYNSSDESFEKIVFEDHEYLIYKNHEILHNPNCPCRKMFNFKRECQ